MREHIVPPDPNLSSVLGGHPITRRQMLRAAGAGALGLSFAGLMAACGNDGDGSAGADGTSSPSAAGFDWDSQEIAGILDFGNWPYYMDIGDVDGERGHPSLAQFTEDTGIEVDYREVIDDLASFFAKIQPQLEAGQATGYDLIMMGYPRWLEQMYKLDYLIPLDPSLRPNFDRYVADSYKNPPWDPGNTYGMPYFSIITGIGYDPELTGREITSIMDLFDPEFAGKVGMVIGIPEDMPNLALLAIGVEPSESTPADWQKAADLLADQRDAGIVRQYYGQGYIGDLQRGDLAISMAWAPDIRQSNISGFPNLKFVIPEEGGLLATDTLCIPKGAEHPLDAATYMDYIYQPRIQALMTSWVGAIPPVPDTKQELARTGFKDLATSPLIFPSEDDYANLHDYRSLTPEEQEQWDDLFLPISQS